MMHPLILYGGSRRGAQIWLGSFSRSHADDGMMRRWDCWAPMIEATLRQCLERLVFAEAHVPASWRIVALYEKLVRSGFAVEIANESETFRRFSITTAGRVALAS